MKKIKKNKKLWQEILHHSHILLNQYKSENQNKYDSTNFFYNFVKVECTSTYPRLTFIIKFLPILNGVSLIHVYSQNKLSRYNDTDTSITLNKNYREIDILYGSEIKNSSNIEFRYTEPKKLKEIEKFFLEFLLSTVNKFNLFYNPLLDMKYFDNFLIQTIDDIINQNKIMNVENIISKINSKFFEFYQISTLNKKNSGKNLFSNAFINENNYDLDLLKKGKNYIKFYNFLDGDNLNTNFMNINKQFILRELFLNMNSGNKFNFKNNNDNNESFVIGNNNRDNTLILSKYEDRQNLNNDFEMSLDLTKQFSDISRMDLNEDDNLGLINSFIKITNGNILTTNNINPITDINNSATFDNIIITEKENLEIIKNKLTTGNIDNSPISNSNKNYPITVTKSLNNLQQNISNIENRIRNKIPNTENNLMKINDPFTLNAENNIPDLSIIDRKIEFKNKINYDKNENKIAIENNSDYKLDNNKIPDQINSYPNLIFNENDYATFR